MCRFVFREHLRKALAIPQITLCEGDATITERKHGMQPVAAHDFPSFGAKESHQMRPDKPFRPRYECCSLHSRRWKPASILQFSTLRGCKRAADRVSRVNAAERIGMSQTTPGRGAMDTKLLRGDRWLSLRILARFWSAHSGRLRSDRTLRKHSPIHCVSSP